MTLDLLKIHNLRNIEKIEFSPGARINLIHGINGSGKTTLLESIYLLGRGRSFRDAKIGALIKEGKNSLDIFSTHIQEKKATLNIGIRKQGKKTEVRVNQKSLNKLSKLARLVPIQLLTPRSHEILERGPQYRRRFLEWGVFHVEQDYQNTYKRFMRVLNQRNAALRTSSIAAKYWNSEFVSSAQKLNNYRELYLDKLKKTLNEELAFLVNNNTIELRWKRGWKDGESLEDLLEKLSEKDSQLGFTQLGPQRADLQIIMSGDQINKRASRGEQKMVIASLQIAQARITSKYSERSPIILIDDLPSELDTLNRRNFIQRLVALETQIFITAIDKSSLIYMADPCVFHVEHGQII